MSRAEFEKNVFVNCPFDEDYEPILQAILFCITWFGLKPRLATERNDAGEARLAKINSLIKNSKYSIHDLSRCQASKAGEFYRMNMPFELGLDFGCKVFSRGKLNSKTILVLEEKTHNYDIALSDLSGSDIESHNGKYDVAIRKVRNWLVGQDFKPRVGAAKIISDYEDFLEWYYEEQEKLGFNEDDILDYSTPELLDAMVKWLKLGKPI